MSDDSSPPHDERLNPNEPIETTFRRLRRDGHSRLEAVRVILDVLDVSLDEAKRILLTSETWAEARDEVDPGSDVSSSPDVPPPAPG